MSSASIENAGCGTVRRHAEQRRRVMVIVMVALTPATLFGFWLYGWPAIYLWMITVAAAASAKPSACA
jgi:Na+-translocating ferredoxin:NAD+ oxidoreductase RnfD subunit